MDGAVAESQPASGKVGKGMVDRMKVIEVLTGYLDKLDCVGCDRRALLDMANRYMDEWGVEHPQLVEYYRRLLNGSE